jgi:hypothetical protein
MLSEGPSIPQVTAPTPLNTYRNAKEGLVPTIIPDFVRTSPVPSVNPLILHWCYSLGPRLRTPLLPNILPFLFYR